VSAWFEHSGPAPALIWVPPFRVIVSTSTKATRLRSLRESAAAHQRQLVEHALAEQHGNYAAAARALGMDRGNFHRLAKRLGLRV